MHEPIDLHLIGGCGSSGTTLLAHVLHGTHDIWSGPELAAFHHRALFDEDHFHRNLYRCVAGQGLRIGLQVGTLDFPLVPGVFFQGRDYYGVPNVDDEHEMLQEAADLPALLRWMKAKMAKARGIEDHFLWLDQTPKNSVCALEFLQSVPESRFIHLIRDGRDVAASLSARYAREEPGHDESAYVLASIARWCFDTRAALRARDEPGYLEVRYEDFVKDPLTWTNRILGHLDRPAISREDLENRESPTDLSVLLNGAKPTWTSSPSGPITTKAVGRWRGRFSDKVMSCLRDFRFTLQGEPREYHFGGQLDELGYV
jgi:hypothetical protein